MEREGHVADGAKVMTDGAALAIGLFDDRIAFPQGQTFQTVGTVGLADNPVPPARLIATPAAGNLREDAVAGSQTEAIHRLLQERESQDNTAAPWCGVPVIAVLGVECKVGQHAGHQHSSTNNVMV